MINKTLLEDFYNITGKFEIMKIEDFTKIID